jgi:hypothetical protein
MTIIRVLAAATIAGSVGSLIGVLTAPPASAAALQEGLYSFYYDGSKKTTDSKPDPMRTTMIQEGIRSACPPAGCVATGFEVGSASHSMMPNKPPNQWVYRENNGQWEGSRPRDYDCNGEKVSGSQTQSFQVMFDGTLSGMDTQRQDPCGTVVVPFTARLTSSKLPELNTDNRYPYQDPNTV